MIQTVDNQKLAINLNTAWEKIEIENKQPFSVLIQINTSGEEGENYTKQTKKTIIHKNLNF